MCTHKYINIYNKITQVDSTCEYAWALISQVTADISLGQRIFCIYISADVSLSVCVCVCTYVCNIGSVLPSVGFLVKRAHKCLTSRAMVTIAPRGIIEETLMYIANYQK